MGVGQPGSYLLRLFGAHAAAAFDHTPYHVGSSLTQKRGWRDVDVRLILPDVDYAALLGGAPASAGHDAMKLNAQNLAWSVFGRELTGLPIDFQLQQQTLANSAPENEGPRSALALVHDDLPFAVPFGG